MKNLYILLLVNILFLNAAFAQSPGYMGKKLAIKYNLNTFPTTKYTNSDYAEQNIDLGSPINGLNLQHEAVLEYALFKKSTVGIMVSSAKAGFYYNEYNTINYQSYERIGKINQIGYGLFFRAYSGGSLALVGKYFQIDYSVLKTQLEFPNKNYLSKDLNGFLFGMTFGTQKILFDRLIYEVGFRTSLAINSSIFENNDVLTSARNRMFYGNLILIKIGLGTLVI